MQQLKKENWLHTPNKAPPVRVLFLDDSKLDIKMMKLELKASGFRFISKEAYSKIQFMDALISFKPDVILADYSMPMFNGMHAFRLFKEQNISIPFILVTGTLDEELSLDCLKEGVDDFVLKSNYKHLPHVISQNLKRNMAEKEKVKIAAELEMRKKELKTLRENAEKTRSHQILSNREYEILCLIALGKSVKEIAYQLILSPSTIATYRSRLLEKLEINSNVGLTRYVLMNKLIN